VSPEEDAWLPVPLVTTSTSLLLVGTSAPAAVDERIAPADETLWLQLPKYVVSWHPTLVSDPTDGGILAPAGIDDEVWLTSILLPPVTFIVSPWSYGSDEVSAVAVESDTGWTSAGNTKWKVVSLVTPWRVGENEPLATPFGIDDDAWQNAIKLPPVTYLVAPWEFGSDEIVLNLSEDDSAFSLLRYVLWRPSRILTPWRDGENEPLITTLHVEDEYWLPKNVVQGVLIGQDKWLLDRDSIVIPPAAVVHDEYYWSAKPILNTRLARIDQWKFEQHETTIFVPIPPEPPPTCLVEEPTGTVITVETPSGPTIVGESPAEVSVNRDNPSVVSFVNETLGTTSVDEESAEDPCD
jgi:hypothetical protein